MESKQTATEWLIEQVKSPEWQEMYTWHKECVFDEIKAMEKKQIIEAFKHGELPPLFVNINAEQYYNETYNI